MCNMINMCVCDVDLIPFVLLRYSELILPFDSLLECALLCVREIE